MNRHEYVYEMRKVFRSRELRKTGKIPREIYDYGWEKAKTEPQKWIVERVIFWKYAYDRFHKWTKKDFDYVINDAAWEKAKEMRRRRRVAKAHKAKDYYNRPRPIKNIVETSWDEASGSLQRVLDKLGFKTLEEAVFGNKESG